MPCDPSPIAITTINGELFFEDVIQISFDRDEDNINNYWLDGSRWRLDQLVKFIQSEKKEDCLIKVYFSPHHIFYKRFPSLNAYECTFKGLQRLIKDYPHNYYPAIGKSTDLDNPTTHLID